MLRCIVLVMGFLALSSFGALPRYASCKEVLELEQLAFRLMEVSDLDAVQAFLPVRTPASHWRRAYFAQRSRHGRTGVVVRGRTDDNIEQVIAAAAWRVIPEGIELSEFHVRPGRYRALGLESWILARVQKMIGEKIIRILVPDMDIQRRRQLLALGFVQVGVDANGFEMPGLLDAHVFVYRPEGEEEETPATPAETTPAALGSPSMLQPGEGERLLDFVHTHTGHQDRDKVAALHARSLPRGEYGTFVAVTRDSDGDITSIVVYRTVTETMTFHIEYALFPNRTPEEQRELIEYLHLGALSNHYEWLEIDLTTFGGDPEPFRRFGFFEAEGSNGQRLRYQPGM